MEEREREVVDRPHRGPPHFRDAIALVCLGTLITAMLVYLFKSGAIVGIDSIVALYPHYELLGNRLRSGDLPLWNPSVLSGAPLAANPQSGWLYLPVMVAFGLFSIATAAVLLSAFHLLLAGFGTYALARTLTMRPIGATAAAIAFVGSGWYTQRIGCCPSDIGVASLLPLAVLGVERGLLAQSQRARVSWYIFTGFVLSQIFDLWMGQGSYYTFLAVGAYMLYRNLVEPGSPLPWVDRLRSLVIQGAIVGATAFGLAAGGLLPRLEFYQHSTLADGYPGEHDAGWSLFRATERLLGQTSTYTGAIVLPLAFFALLILRCRCYAPFWAGLALFAFIFSTDSISPVRDLFYALLPKFESVQQQLPNRILVIGFFALAMLAGAAIDALPSWRPGRIERIAAVVLGASFALYEIWIDGRAQTVSSRTMLLTLAIIVVLVTVAFLPRIWNSVPGRLLPICLLIAMTSDLLVFGYQETQAALDRGTLSREDLATYYDPSPAAQFLLNQPATEPFLYLGIDPALGQSGRNGVLLYGRDFASPITAELIVNNRASLLGLQDVQGINMTMRFARYDDYFLELNGTTQDYHNETVLSWESLQSPLIDLLNIRYIIVPRASESLSPADEAALSRFTEVYADAQVRILENPDALPRAWIVHETQVAPADSTLALLNSGTVDSRQVALTTEPIPEIAPGSASASNSVEFTSYEAGSIDIDVQVEQTSLLVLSEQSVPGWHLTIDGRSAELHTVNALQQGIVVPTGAHHVELHYLPRSFVIGMTITGITLLAILVAGAVLLWRSRDSWLRPRRAFATG